MTRSDLCAAINELRLDRSASWAVHDALRIPVGGGFERGAHLWCGSGFATANWSGQRSCSWTGIDEDRALIAQARARPFASANNIGAFFANGGLPSQVSETLRGDTTFRCERVSSTSIRTHDVDRIVLNWGLRGECEDARAVAAEICRIGKPGVPLVIVHHRVLRIDEWCIDDVLYPLLVDARRRWSRPSGAFATFKPLPIRGAVPMYAVGSFDLTDVIAHLEARPECRRLLATHGWPGTGYLFRHLKRHWGRKTIKRGVRCRVDIFVGSVPQRFSEQLVSQPLLGGGS